MKVAFLAHPQMRANAADAVAPTHDGKRQIMICAVRWHSSCCYDNERRLRKSLLYGQLQGEPSADLSLNAISLT